MKTGFFIVAVLAWLQVVVAVPHSGRIGKAHRALHRAASASHKLVKKDDVVVVTDVVEETDVVYMKNGEPYATVIQTVPVATSEPQETTSTKSVVTAPELELKTSQTSM